MIVTERVCRESRFKLLEYTLILVISPDQASA